MTWRSEPIRVSTVELWVLPASEPAQKIDNLVQVGHNVNIGERCVIAAQTGISGSVTIEDDCVIGGQVGFGDHVGCSPGGHWLAGGRFARKDSVRPGV